MIDLVRSGRNPDDLAKEFEPSAQTIRNWVQQADLRFPGMRTALAGNTSFKAGSKTGRL